MLKKREIYIFILGVLVGIWIFSLQTNKSISERVDMSKEVVVAEVSPTPSTENKKDFYEVIKVSDGDTIQIMVNDKKQTVRMIGVDTPESVDPRRPVQCFGEKASQKTSDLLLNKKVSLESDTTQGDVDKYKRLLRYVFLEDGTNVNKLLIEQGFGHQYTYNKPYKYREEFIKAETEARENKKGLWADGACDN